MSNKNEIKPLVERCGRTCVFDPLSDYQEVESGLSVDLSETLKTGVVKESNITLDSNGIEDPEQIVGRVSNRFDAIEAERAVRKYGKKADVGQYTQNAEPAKNE